MKKEKFIKKIKIFDDRLIEVLQDYYLIERMADWAEYIGQSFYNFASTFIPMKRALYLNFVILYTSNFDKRSHYDINELLKSAKSEDWCSCDIADISNKIADLINNNITSSEDAKNGMPQTNITDLAMKYRDKVLAHLDIEGIDEQEFKHFSNQYKLPVYDMLKNCQYLHFYLNKIRELLGYNKRRIFPSDQSVDLMMTKLFNTNTIPKSKADFSYLEDIDLE